MQSLLQKLRILFSDKTLMKRIAFVGFVFMAFRFASAIPIPGVDPIQIQSLLSGNQFLNLLNIFSGGGLTQLSIVMLGVGPYITASIIMQLMTAMVPALKDLYHNEGELGRKRFNQYSRLLTLPIGIIQGIGFLVYLSSASVGILPPLTVVGMISNLIIILAGAMLVTWLGELISEFGLGNGVSLIIMAGIIAILPSQISGLVQTFSIDQLPVYIGFLIAAVLIIAGIVFVSEGERPVPVTYAKQSRGGETYGGTSTYIPLRVNMSGVMPLIFAISILLFPQMAAGFFANSESLALQNASITLQGWLNNGWIYSIAYFLLVFVFTYFYTAITFDPEAMASNLQKNGAFIPGVRPGETTVEYIGQIVSRITFIGALFLGIIAVVPVIMQSVTGVQAFAIGGTSLLIAVAVVTDLIKKVDAQIAMRRY